MNHFLGNPREKKTYGHPKICYVNVHSSIIHNSQTVETAQMSINSWITKIGMTFGLFPDLGYNQQDAAVNVHVHVFGSYRFSFLLGKNT